MGEKLEDHFRKLENMYHSIVMSEDLQTVAKISKGKTTITMPIKKDYFHAAQALHGMYYFKLLDDSAFFAANSLVDDVFVLTSQYNLHFLRPVTAGKLQAEGIVLHESKSQIIAESVVYNDENQQIGRGTGTFVKSNIKLDKIPAYSLIKQD